MDEINEQIKGKDRDINKNKEEIKNLREEKDNLNNKIKTLDDTVAQQKKKIDDEQAKYKELTK